MITLDFLSLEIMLPFFLVLAIVYGALQISKVFDSKPVKVIIAVVFAFFAIMNSEVVSLINTILPYAAGFFVIIFIIWIILKPLRGEGKGKGIDPVLVIIILGLLMLIFARLSDTGYTPTSGLLADPNILWIIGVIIVLFIIWKAYKMGATGEGGK